MCFLFSFLLPMSSKGAMLSHRVYTICLHTQPLFGDEIQDKNKSMYPYSLDDRAIWIFTPGYFFFYDPRDDMRDGFSIAGSAGVITSCYGDPGAAFGPGLHYLKTFGNFFFEFGWYLNALIYPKKWQPTWELDTEYAMFKGELAHLGYFLFHDIPGTEFKLVLPLPVYIDVGLGYKLSDRSAISFGLSVAGIQVVSHVTLSVSI